MISFELASSLQKKKSFELASSIDKQMKLKSMF
jgi:hypothetical protein